MTSACMLVKRCQALLGRAGQGRAGQGRAGQGSQHATLCCRAACCLAYCHQAFVKVNSTMFTASPSMSRPLRPLQPSSPWGGGGGGKGGGGALYPPSAWGERGGGWPYTPLQPWGKGGRGGRARRGGLPDPGEGWGERWAETLLTHSRDHASWQRLAVSYLACTVICNASLLLLRACPSTIDITCCKTAAHGSGHRLPVSNVKSSRPLPVVWPDSSHRGLNHKHLQQARRANLKPHECVFEFDNGRGEWGREEGEAGRGKPGDRTREEGAKGVGLTQFCSLPMSLGNPFFCRVNMY